jgi:hypothetical protein
MTDVLDFYSGFEGEPELAVSLEINGQVEQVVRIWIGYFDQLMHKVLPDAGAWTGLALPYHLNTGWYDSSPRPWRLPTDSLQTARIQWDGISADDCYEGAVAVHNAVSALLSEAAARGGTALFTYS